MTSINLLYSDLSNNNHTPKLLTYTGCMSDLEISVCVFFDVVSHFLVDIGHVFLVFQIYHQYMVIDTELMCMEVHNFFM